MTFTLKMSEIDTSNSQQDIDKIVLDAFKE